MIWYLLLLGFILYLMVRRNVSQVTSTPWPLLWVVLMIPAFVIVFWKATQPNLPIPFLWLFLSFIFSASLYLLLLRRRWPTQASSEAKPDGSPQNASPTAATCPEPLE